MDQLLPRQQAHAGRLHWRYRDRELPWPGRAWEIARDTRELISTPVVQRADLSASAKRLFSALGPRDDYVVCFDPHTLATAVGGEQKVRSGLNELTRAGVISSWIGNLVFFD